jgi:hypothetical protein
MQEYVYYKPKDIIYDVDSSRQNREIFQSMIFLAETIGFLVCPPWELNDKIYYAYTTWVNIVKMCTRCLLLDGSDSYVDMHCKLLNIISTRYIVLSVINCSS